MTISSIFDERLFARITAFNTPTIMWLSSYTGTAKMSTSVFNDRDTSGSETKRLPAFAAWNHSRSATEIFCPLEVVREPEVSYRLSCANLLLKETSFCRRFSFSVYGVAGSERIGIRAMPSRNWKLNVILPSIISATSSALSVRWASTFSDTALRAILIANIPSETEPTTIKQPKINTNFVFNENLFLLFVCCIVSSLYFLSGGRSYDFSLRDLFRYKVWYTMINHSDLMIYHNIHRACFKDIWTF